MKTLNLTKLLSILLMLNFIAKGQTYTCGTPTTTNNNTYSGCSSCTSLQDYIPDEVKDSIMYIKLNIYFTLPTTGYQGPFANVTSYDADLLIYGLNTIADSLYSANLKKYPLPQYIKRSRLRFTLNSYQKFADNAIYYGPDVPYHYSVPPPTYYNNSTAFNVIFNVDTNTWTGNTTAGGYGIAGNIGSSYLNMRANIGQSQTFVWWHNHATLFHELGHCFGLFHTDINQFFDGCVNDYKLETTEWNIAGGTCNADTTRSNNIMGYNFNCRVYFSPLQLARVYKTIKTNYNERIVITPNNYIIGTNPNFNYNVVTNETWTINRYFKGNITVKAGKTLIVKCQLEMPEKGKIIVEKGAKLVIDGGEVTNIFGKLWTGIEIEGTSTQNQSLSGGYGVYQGYVNIINGGTISNADCAINTGTTDASGNFDWSSTGGIIIANTANFINNRKDVQFLYYHSGSGGNLSSFTYCNFKINSLINGGLLPDSRVSLYEVDAIPFRGCSFEYNAGAAYSVGNRGTGINSIDATYTIDQQSTTKTQFKNLTNGVYVNNSNPLRVVSIKNTNFYDNLSYSTYYNTVTTPIFEYNYVRTSSSDGSSVGLYLNNCTLYNVNNNTFLRNTSLLSGGDVGIYVNNSQSGAHKIYRNSFAGFNIGIGTIDNNSGVANNTTGLKMNCNDFTPVRNNYDIAVMGTYAPTVMKDQGLSTSDPKTLVRNKYAAISTGSGDENKWYIEGTSVKTINHAANSDANMRPTPQPANSDVNLNVTSSGAAFSSTNCPATESTGGGGGNGSGRLSNINSTINNLVSENVMATAKGVNPTESKASFDLQVAIAEKLNYFLLDTVPQSKDSVIALLQNNHNGIDNADVLLTYAYINKGDFNKAQQNVTALATKKADWANLQAELITLYQSPKHLFDLNANAAVKNVLESYAATEGKDGRGAAQSILKLVNGQNYFIPHLVPLVEGGVNKSMQNPLLISEGTVQNTSFNVYPNPANSIVNFIYKGNNENTHISLSNTLGTVVYQADVKPNSKTEISLSNFETGVYLLTAYKGKLKVYQTKVMCIK